MDTPDYPGMSDEDLIALLRGGSLSPEDKRTVSGILTTRGGGQVETLKAREKIRSKEQLPPPSED